MPVGPVPRAQSWLAKTSPAWGVCIEVPELARAGPTMPTCYVLGDMAGGNTGSPAFPNAAVASMEAAVTLSTHPTRALILHPSMRSTGAGRHAARGPPLHPQDRLHHHPGGSQLGAPGAGRDICGAHDGGCHPFPVAGVRVLGRAHAAAGPCGCPSVGFTPPPQHQRPASHVWLPQAAGVRFHPSVDRLLELGRARAQQRQQALLSSSDK